MISSAVASQSRSRTSTTARSTSTSQPRRKILCLCLRCCELLTLRRIQRSSQGPTSLPNNSLVYIYAMHCNAMQCHGDCIVSNSHLCLCSGDDESICGQQRSNQQNEELALSQQVMYIRTSSCSSAQRLTH